MNGESKSVSLATKFKEVFGAMREGVIVVAVIALLVNPSWIGKIAQEAGLKSAFGMEFIEQLEQSQAETEQANQEVERIMSELTQVTGQLRELSMVAAPAMRPRIGEISANVDDLQSRSQDINKSLKSSMQTQKTILEMHKK